MHPIGWFIEYFYSSSGNDGKCADDDDAEKSRAIALFAGGEMQIAFGTMGAHGEQAAENSAFPAAGARANNILGEK